MDSIGAVGQRMLLAFEGKDSPSPGIERAMEAYRPAGITYFRSRNIDHPAQVRALTDSLQSLARDRGMPPLLIATDQEGGQLMAIGDGTPLPGNMALGAAGSDALARRAGEVLGRELAAVGVNVNYAPCVDVNVNPHNPVVGIRSFGDDPRDVARLGAAMIAGIQSQGVAATAKHFPGHGDTATDSHRGLPVVPHSLERLRSLELIPFRAAVDAGVQLVMAAHVSLPAIDGPEAPPATLSRNVLQGLLREEAGFQGVIVTDALDMHAIQQGEALGGEAVRAAAAGADLLLVTADPQDHRRVHSTLAEAARAGTLEPSGMAASLQRVRALKGWLAQNFRQPDLSVIRSAEHLAVAAEIAERSITLVRDDTGLLPLRPGSGDRMAALVPQPLDLTPADTSSYIRPGLASALREYHPDVLELALPYAPSDEDIRSLLHGTQDCDLIVVGTINAFEQPGQAALVGELLRTGKPVIVAALRLPYDLAAFPEAPAYLCTYGVLEPSMHALARVLFGQSAPQGRLPAAIPGLYRTGHSSKR